MNFPEWHEESTLEKMVYQSVYFSQQKVLPFYEHNLSYLLQIPK